MRYYCISDVHGEYDKMIEALEDAAFNKDTDTLISIGDLFDRGEKSREVLEFVMSCPHRILIMGNHDLRLMQLINDPFQYNGYDTHNGVCQTLISMLKIKDDEKVNIIDALVRLKADALLKQYFHECIAAVEFSNYVITHGWIPVNELSYSRYEPYHIKLENGMVGDWHQARVWDWENATWAHTEIMVSNKLFPVGKTMIIGHWHAWRLAQKFGEKRVADKHDNNTYINCNSFTYRKDNEIKFIAIDGCSNYKNGGQVNVYDFESNEIPEKIWGGFRRWCY